MSYRILLVVTTLAIMGIIQLYTMGNDEYFSNVGIFQSALALDVGSTASSATSSASSTASSATSSASSTASSATSSASSTTSSASSDVSSTVSSTTNDVSSTGSSTTSLEDAYSNLTSGYSIEELDLATIDITNSTDATIIIPIIVTNEETSGQTVTTLPSTKIIPGQQIVISVDDSLIPSYGGLKQIILPVSQTAKPIGETLLKELFVAEISNKLPSSIPLGNLNEDPILFVSVKYLFEEAGIGYNWGDPANYSPAPMMTLVVNKTDMDSVQRDSLDCPILEAFTLSDGSWTSNGLGEISSRPISQTQCYITVQTQHFSKFAFSLKHIDSIENTGPGQFGVGTVLTDLQGPSSGVIGEDNSEGSISLFSLMKFINPSLIANAELSEGFSNPGFIANAEQLEGFSNLECSQGRTHVIMTGQYTNGDTPYKIIFLKIHLLDSKGNVLSSAGDYISDVGPHETKNFLILTRHHGNYDSCSVQIQQKFTR